jgi:hypothetical protein
MNTFQPLIVSTPLTPNPELSTLDPSLTLMQQTYDIQNLKQEHNGSSPT